MSVVTSSMPRSVEQVTAEVDVRRAFETHHAFVYRLVYRVTGSGPEAEDVTQEAFLRLHDRRLPTNREADVRAWLCRVALNLAYNAHRTARRRERRESRAATDAAARGALPSDPADALMRDADVAAVRRALSALPERQARLLQLRYAGLSYREVAQAVDVSPASVGTLLARAEDAFEAAFRNQQPDLRTGG
jgi:RNA polymerase sigma-70 factor (ECF subfamily)